MRAMLCVLAPVVELPAPAETVRVLRLIPQ